MANITGTGAFGAEPARLYCGSRYRIGVKSRALYVGPKRNEMGELLEFVSYCNFQDSADYNVTLTSDLKRYKSETEYNSGAYAINNQSAAGQRQFRQSITVVAPAGFVGTFYQFEIEKSVPASGAFEWSGGDLVVIPRPHLRGEFFTIPGALANGW